MSNKSEKKRIKKLKVKAMREKRAVVRIGDVLVSNEKPKTNDIKGFEAMNWESTREAGHKDKL